MRKVTESIFNGKTVIIPMADVQHIEKYWYHGDDRTQPHKGYHIITKHTKWNTEIDTWENNIHLSREEGDLFLQCWCRYRGELEGIVNYKNLQKNEQ